MWFRDTAEIKNFYRAQFAVDGDYGIPVIEGIERVEPTVFIGFNYAKSLNKRSDKTCHFYLDDYQFNRVWAHPDKSVALLSGFRYVLTPDFSLYTDYPQAIQIYNHYRKHWCGAFWQSIGMDVIPTISWGDERSFDWCFDGEPHNSVVSVSTVGCMRNKEVQKAFTVGFDAMMERLNPCKVLAFGISFNGLACLEDDRVERVYNRRMLEYNNSVKSHYKKEQPADSGER